MLAGRNSTLSWAIAVVCLGGIGRAVPGQPDAPVLPAPASYLALETDPENCLSCHRFRGLSRIDPETDELRLFFCSAEYYADRQGPHARLRCTACHLAEEVMVIPHDVRTPVDCTRVCHIIPSSGMEIRFSHADILRSLEGSAHAPDALEDLPFDPPLLRPGQSVCLYCHDDPVFRLPEGLVRPIGHGSATLRCENCHTEQMPMDVTYYAHHVSARLRPALPVRRTAQTCAVCHSHRQVIDKMDSHDTVASYLYSFHGKANLLGNHDTATCIDCHASETGDVHAMLGADHPDSPIAPDHRPHTCRTPQCHPGASPNMAQAAVHLNLDPHARSLEYYLAAAFILMTAAVMSVFFLVIILELVNTLLGRDDPDHERLVRLSKRIKQHPEGRARLERLSVHERWQHWVLAITFILLVVTGMPLKFANAWWAEPVIAFFGGLTSARWWHRVCAVLMIAAFFYHIGYLIAKLVESRQHVRDQIKRKGLLTAIFELKPVLGPNDFHQFGQLMAYLLFLRKQRPHFGNFNFMNKFEYWAVFWGIPVMGLSGLVLWYAAEITEYAPGRILNFAYVIHTDEAYLATIYIAVVHIFSVMISPTVFPLSPASLNGQAPDREMAEAHRTTLESVATEMNIPLDEKSVNHGGIRHVLKELVRRPYALLLAIGYAMIGFVSLRFLILLLLTRQTAPVHIVDIPKRLTTQMLAAPLDSRWQTDRRGEPPRGPLSHFHVIPQWFQPDPYNTCSTAGCHEALPHSERVEVRAFLNMHATFLDCGVCHGAGAEQAAEAHWLSLEDRAPQTPPAILRLTRLLEETRTIEPDQREAFHDQVTSLLREAIERDKGGEALNDWLVRLETAHPQSGAWLTVLERMRARIRFHVQGEYNAKIALFDDGRALGAPSPAQLNATRRFLAMEDRLSPQEHEYLLDVIHEDIAPTGLLCTPCHAPAPALIDLDALGYPPSRIESVSNSVIVNQMLRIERGERFSLPQIVEERHTPPPP